MVAVGWWYGGGTHSHTDLSPGPSGLSLSLEPGPNQARDEKRAISARETDATIVVAPPAAA